MWTLLFIIKHSKTHSDYLPSDDNIKGFIVKQWGHEWVTKGLVHPTPLFACGASKLARDCFPLPGHHLIARHRIQKSWTRWMAIILDKSYCYKIRCICGFSFFFFSETTTKAISSTFFYNGWGESGEIHKSGQKKTKWLTQGSQHSSALGCINNTAN